MERNMHVPETIRRGRVTAWAVVCALALAALPTVGWSAEREVEEIVVTGSYIKRQNQADLGSPIDTFGLEEIRNTGFNDVDDITKTFTYNTGVIGTIDLRNNDGGGRRSSINLRGLGVSSTLVLLNSKRVATTDTDIAGNDFTNIKVLIPLIAVDRMETVLDGASALYGSDAVAGVVNVLTRDNFEGIEFQLSGTDFEGSDEQSAQFIVGGGGDRMHGMLAMSYTRSGMLLNREREVTNVNNTSGTGSPGTYTLRQRPVAAGGGDVIIDNGVNGPVNYSQLFDNAIAGTGAFAGVGPQANLRVADPNCYPGLVPGFRKGDNFVPGGGQFSPAFAGAPFPVGTCRFSFQPNNSIIPEENTWMLFTKWRYDLDEFHSVKLQGGYAKQETRRGFIATFPITNGTPTVPANNPFNPFGVDAAWTGRAEGLGLPTTVVNADRTTTRFAVDFEGSLGWMDADWAQNWTWTLSGQYSEEQNGGEFPDTDLIAIQQALEGFGGRNCNIRFGGPAASEVPGQGNCAYFSPFGAQIGENDPRVSFNTRTLSMSQDERSLRVLEFVTTGDLPVELPGGNIGVAFGYNNRQHIRELFDSNFRQTFRQGFISPQNGGKGGRTVDAFFAEASLPLTEKIDIQLAVRREDYDLFDSTDPKVSINYRVTDWLTMRASGGSAFRAPGLAQVVGDDGSSFLTEIRDVADPSELLNGTFRTIINAKNPTLEPEESDNFNVGISMLPMDDLQIDLDYWDYEFENQIIAEDPAALVRDDPFNSQIIRDPNNIIPGCLITPPPGQVCGEIIIVNTGFFNAASTQTSGVDLSITYTFDIGANLISLRSETTWISEYEFQPAPGQAVIDGVGRRNGSNAGSPTPEFRSNLFVNWSRDRHHANVTVRYVDEFFDDVFVADGSIFGVGDVNEQIELDAQYGYYFGEDQQYHLVIGAINLLDNEPPKAGFTGFEPRVHDPIGRRAYMRFGVALQ